MLFIFTTYVTDVWASSQASTSGALGYESSQGSVSGGSTLIMRTGTIRFNAWNSNNIYVDSGKVYPLSLALNFIIKC